MPIYTIETPTGQRLKIEAPDEATALRGAQEWKPPALPEPKNQSRLGMVDEAMPEGQQPNIGRKGMMKPGDIVPTDVTGQAAQGMTFNLGDEAVAGMGAPLDVAVNKLTGEGPTSLGESYDQIRAFQAAQNARTREEKPYASTAAELTGGLATAPAMVGKAVEGGNLLTKTAKGAATGAAMGGLSGFGSGGESLAGRQAAARSGAASGTIVGTIVPPLASSAGKLVQSASRLGQLGREVGDFGSDKLRAASNAAYEAADQGVGKLKMTRDHLLKLSRQFNETAQKQGLGGAFSEVVTPDYAKSSQRLGAFNKIADEVSKGLRPPPTFGELERLRQGLRGAVTESVTPQGNLTKDGQLASEFIDRIDEMIDATPFKKARNAYKLMRKTEIIEDAFNAAKNATGANYTQAGFETAIRQQFRRIANSKNFERQFTKAEQEAILAVVRPGKIENALRKLGFLAPKGGLSTMFTVGMTFANPFIGAPLAAAGLAGKYGSSAMALKNANKVGNMVANGGVMPQLPAPTTRTRDFLTAAPFGLIPYGASQYGQ